MKLRELAPVRFIRRAAHEVYVRLSDDVYVTRQVASGGADSDTLDRFRRAEIGREQYQALIMTLGTGDIVHPDIVKSDNRVAQLMLSGRDQLKIILQGRAQRRLAVLTQFKD